MHKREWINSKFYKMLCEDDYFNKDDMYPLSGIYRISNKINNKVYIGKSVDVVKRWSTHRNSLRKGKHYNIYLQRAWDKYGEDNFEFEVIEDVEANHLTYFENYHITSYKSDNIEYGYNLMSASEDLNHYSMNDELKSKIGDANTKYSEEELISYLQDFYYHNGRVPSSREMSNKNGYPSRGTYDNKYGNFKNALIEAGLYDMLKSNEMYDRKEYSKDEVIDRFKDFIEKFNRFPNTEELKKCKEYKLPSQSVVLKHFKSIKELKKSLNLDDNLIKEKEKIVSLELLRKLYHQDNHLSARSIDKSSITRSGKYYRDNFGDLSTACKLAGVPYGEHMK